MMSEIPEYLTCPICGDIPKGKVLQCREGHHMCEDCYFQMDNCPFCRTEFDSRSPIRSLLMENLLDELSLECPYKTTGCDTKKSRKSAGDHVDCCKYDIARFGPLISVCKNIGFHNCSFQMNCGNPAESIQHFKTAHAAHIFNSDTLNIEFSNFCSIETGRKLIILNRELDGYAFLVMAICHPTKIDFLTWNAFYLRYPKAACFLGMKTPDLSPSCQVKCTLIGSNSLTGHLSPMDILKLGSQESSSFQMDMPTASFIERTTGNLSAAVKVKHLYLHKQKSTNESVFRVTPKDMKIQRGPTMRPPGNNKTVFEDFLGKGKSRRFSIKRLLIVAMVWSVYINLVIMIMKQPTSQVAVIPNPAQTTTNNSPLPLYKSSSNIPIFLRMAGAAISSNGIAGTDYPLKGTPGSNF